MYNIFVCIEFEKEGRERECGKELGGGAWGIKGFPRCNGPGGLVCKLGWNVEPCFYFCQLSTSSLVQFR